MLTKSKKVIKSTVIGGSAAFVLVASPLAFAHGTSGDRGDRGNRGDRGSYSRQASASQQQKRDKQKQRHNHNNWWNKQREQRKKTCTEQQTAINQRAERDTNKDSKKLNGLNIMLSGVQTYASSEGVTIENYEELNNKAVASQQSATDATAAVVAPQLNCDDTSDETMKANKAAIRDYENKERAADRALAQYRHDVNVLFKAAIES